LCFNDEKVEQSNYDNFNVDNLFIYSSHYDNNNLAIYSSHYDNDKVAIDRFYCDDNLTIYSSNYDNKVAIDKSNYNNVYIFCSSSSI
jgi:hypothetical protein